MRLEILLTMLLFFGGTLFSGYAVRRILRLKHEGILFSIVSGTMLWWAIMELILIPMTMCKASFESFVFVYSIVIVCCTAMGVCHYKDFLEDINIFIKNGKEYINLGHIAALILVCCQLYFIHHHMYLEWDDTYYVNLANEAVYSNRIFWNYPETGTFADFDKRYVLSLWPIFYAWLSKLFRVIPTIMAHTILPWLLIPLAYMVYGLIGNRLFPKERQLQGMFVAFAVLLHLFMSGEHTSGLTFLSITPWVGKGVLATVLIPLLFYWILRISEEDKASIWILLGITCLGGCLLSSMGIMLAPVFIGTAIFIICIEKKNIKYLRNGILACMPCIVLGIYYIYLTH